MNTAVKIVYHDISNEKWALQVWRLQGEGIQKLSIASLKSKNGLKPIHSTKV